MLKLSVMDILLLWHLCINSLFHLLTSICLSFSPSNHQPQNIVSADEKVELISDFSQSFSLTELYCRCSVRTYLQHRNKVKQNSVTKQRKRKEKETKKKRKIFNIASQQRETKLSYDNEKEKKRKNFSYVFFRSL
jgi:hypothetical protein